jgi:hypothetical protein
MLLETVGGTKHGTDIINVEYRINFSSINDFKKKNVGGGFVQYNLFKLRSAVKALAGRVDQ